MRRISREFRIFCAYVCASERLTPPACVKNQNHKDQGHCESECSPNGIGDVVREDSQQGVENPYGKSYREKKDHNDPKSDPEHLSTPPCSVKCNKIIPYYVK